MSGGRRDWIAAAGGAALILGAAALLLLGLLLPAWANVRDAAAAASWSTTRGRVVEAREEVRPGQRNDAWQSRTTRHFAYEYEVDGVTYRRRRYSFESPLGAAKQAVASHAPGAELTVHYSPAVPGRAVIVPDGPVLLNYLALGVGVPGVLALVYLGVRAVRRNTRREVR